jgi:hypothetical protein
VLLVKFWAYVPSARCFSMLTLGSYDVPTLFDVALEIGLTLVNTIGYVFVFSNKDREMIVPEYIFPFNISPAVVAPTILQLKSLFIFSNIF